MDPNRPRLSGPHVGSNVCNVVEGMGGVGLGDNQATMPGQDEKV